MASRRFSIALGALALAAAAAAIAFTWQPGLASVYDDSVSYLVMGQVMSPWHAASPAVADAYALERYPPLFPLLLGLTGGAFDWRIGHALIAISFAASVVLCGVLARAVTGSRATGFAAALVFALLPGAWMNLKGILSDFPYLAFSLAALVAHARIADREAGARDWAAVALLATAALLTRTVGIALVAGLAASEALRWRRSGDAGRLRAAAYALAVPIAAAGLWYLLRPAGRQDTYAAIGADMLRSLHDQGPAWVAHVVLDNLASFGHSWLRALVIFWSAPTEPKVLLASAVGVLAVAGIAWRAVRGKADALYAVAYLAILLLFPFPAHMYRLGLPIVPVLLAAAGSVVVRLAAPLGAPRAGRLALMAGLAPLAVCLPGMLFVAERSLAPSAPGARYSRGDIAEIYRFSAGPMAALVADREIELFEDMDHIRATTPAAARIAWYLPDYLALLTGRTGIAMPPADDGARFDAALEAGRVDYLYVNALRLRDEGTGGADPLAPARLAERYADVVWMRTGADGKPAAALLRIDRNRLDARSRR